MYSAQIDQENYLGLDIDGFVLLEKVGKGKIGFVFKAVKSNPEIIHACKVIPEGKLKQGWERELDKVLKLRGVENVVQYHSHGLKLDRNFRPYNWIFWNFIDGYNLKEYLEKQPSQLTLPFIEQITLVVLKVLYACRQVDIQHGDLHPGNILISKPDPRKFDSKPEIWISDFGYGGSHNSINPKDDFKQLFSITSTLLHKIEPSSLNPVDRIVYQNLEAFCNKKLLEIDPIQGHHLSNLKLLIEEFLRIRVEAENEFAKVSKGERIKEPGDFLSAETLGFRIDEWKHLFVPEFLAAQDLLSKNITILTGARGCGKTMAFRRLTAYMDKIIGQPSGVPGADQFLGFYLNCRDLIEAFPWIPPNIGPNVASQIIHYFHLAWFQEICKTLSAYESKNVEDYDWLDKFLLKICSGRYSSIPRGGNILNHVLSFIEYEKERCRLTDFGKKRQIKWELSRQEFLDELQFLIRENVSWASEKPFYFFLDDYTVPIVPRNVQRSLNPILFKRRSNLFFKISTESATSFEKIGIRGKPLELHQDFELIDLATESLYQDPKDKLELIEKIFKPRIDRHELLKGKNLSLSAVLGNLGYSSNELAWSIRNSAIGAEAKKKVTYQGIQAFVGMWASDIRIMIQLFVDILREAHTQLKAGEHQIIGKIQDKVLRAAGGEFLAYAASVPNPAFLERQMSIQKNTSFGNHLKDIVEAFINVSKYELTKGELVSNQTRYNPKQAFRLEIIDRFDLETPVQDYYDGLVRWHIFLQDWRGKSVRGMITPRLFLNRILIPHSQLTFSSHDNIQLSSQELSRLLIEPKGFLEYWKKKRLKGNKATTQSSLDFKNKQQ